jgi:predicted tellurium resistance membrane protein TerC
MFRELRRPQTHAAQTGHTKTLRQSLTEIIIADLSMSLDNVLAVAGAAQGSTWVLAIGLLLSVVLMGVAANILANLLERYRWIAWVGLLVVLYVAATMIWHGAFDVAEAVRG